MDFNMIKLRKLMSRLQEELPAKEDSGAPAPDSGTGDDAPASLLSRIIDEEESSGTKK